ncbi:hypothetical protein [[Mycoplasma] mobile]|uniref:hypothetical protein n=1 Tax=[Mycoplasma] mobile TaxID=2118 RepID=UPI0002DC948F|nr:hypothetical protein [[Mycoplasma] mobile]
MEELVKSKINFIIFYLKSVKTKEKEDVEEIIDFSAIKISDNNVVDFMQIFIKPINEYNSFNFIETGIEEKHLLEFGLDKVEAYEKINHFFNSNDYVIDFGFNFKDLILLKTEISKYINPNFLNSNTVINLKSLLKQIVNHNIFKLKDLAIYFNQKNQFLPNVYSNVILLSKVFISFDYLLERNKISIIHKTNFKKNESWNELFVTEELLNNLKKTSKTIIDSDLFNKKLLKFKISLRLKIENKLDLSLKKNQRFLISDILESQELNLDDLYKSKEIHDSVEFALDELRTFQDNKKKLKQKIKPKKEEDIYKYSNIRKEKASKSKLKKKW